MKLKDITKEGWYQSIENPEEIYCVMKTCNFPSLHDIKEPHCFDIWNYTETVDGIKHYECQDAILNFLSYTEADTEVVFLDKDFEVYGNSGCFCKEKIK